MRGILKKTKTKWNKKKRWKKTKHISWLCHIIYISILVCSSKLWYIYMVYWLTSSSGVWQIIFFEPWSSQTKDYKIGVSCISAKHTTVKSKNKNWLGRNHDNVVEWSHMSTRGTVSWLWIMIMCQSEATCPTAEQWTGSESW